MKKRKSFTLSSPLSDRMTKKLRLNHDRTESEEIISLKLLLLLKEIGYSGEVHFRTFIANQFGQFRRPDIYFPRYGLAIEIDGRTRESIRSRQSDFVERDKFYHGLGIRLLTLHSEIAVNDLKIERLKRELINTFHTDRLTPKIRTLLNKNICVGRKVLQRRNPLIFQSHGTKAPVFIQELESHGIKSEFRHFGGTKFIFRTKYQQRSNFFKKLDLNNNEYMKNQMQYSALQRAFDDLRK